MRAFLVYLGYRTGSGKDLKKILPISLAFEITQSFFLIHDDIIDNSDLRRGKPTIHKIYAEKFGEEYGRSMAIVMGDVACIELFELVNKSDFPQEVRSRCLEKLSEILLETAYGQLLDIENSHTKPALAQIYQVADLKTARYSFVAPMTIGAILAGATRYQIKAINEFAGKVGLAFQIQDDILGVFGSEKVLGKSILSDMREGKNTILLYKARKLVGARDLLTINRIWGNLRASADDLAKVSRIIARCGARKWCEGENRRLVSLAKNQVKGITGDEHLAQILVELADYSVNREK